MKTASNNFFTPVTFTENTVCSDTSSQSLWQNQKNNLGVCFWVQNKPRNAAGKKDKLLNYHTVKYYIRLLPRIGLFKVKPAILKMRQTRLEMQCLYEKKK